MDPWVSKLFFLCPIQPCHYCQQLPGRARKVGEREAGREMEGNSDGYTDLSSRYHAQ